MSRPPISDINSKTGLLPGLGNIPPKAPVASFSLDGVESLLQTKGMSAYHIRHAFPADKETTTGPIMPSEQKSQQRGFVYYNMRKITIVPYSFKLEERMQVQAFAGQGSCTLNIAGNYDDDLPNPIVYVRNHDIILPNPTVSYPVEEIFEYNPNGKQRLKYYIKGVDILFDADKHPIYNPFREDVDFRVCGGEIEWLDGGDRPTFINGKGRVLSIVYFATPVLIVSDVPHNLRILPTNPQGSGAFPREMAYFPQLLICKFSQNIEETGLGFFDISNLPEYRASLNLTGGSI